MQNNIEIVRSSSWFGFNMTNYLKVCDLLATLPNNTYILSVSAEFAREISKIFGVKRANEHQIQTLQTPSRVYMCST